MNSKKYVIKNDLVYSYRNDGLVMELPKDLINNVLYTHHDHQFSGHHGITRTYKRIRERYNFPQMKKIVENYVKSCKDCLTRRRPTGKPYGMMQIPKASQPAYKYFMDYLGPFVTSYNNNKYVFVCVDGFTRYVETAATKDSTAETTIEILVNSIICRHGMFSCLISDRAKSFMSRVVQGFAERTGIAHIKTTSFHPQSNISERVNASIANMLSNYCGTNHKDWDVMLSSITLALNTQYHRSIDTTPFYLMYARHCILPGDIPIIESNELTRGNRWKIACDLAKIELNKFKNITSLFTIENDKRCISELETKL